VQVEAANAEVEDANKARELEAEKMRQRLMSALQQYDVCHHPLFAGVPA
jgi:hypothetical protein